MSRNRAAVCYTHTGDLFLKTDHAATGRQGGRCGRGSLAPYGAGSRHYCRGVVQCLLSGAAKGMD